MNIQTTTSRENELLAMAFEKNSIIEQLDSAKRQLSEENAKLKAELDTLKKQEA